MHSLNHIHTVCFAIPDKLKKLLLNNISMIRRILNTILRKGSSDDDSDKYSTVVPITDSTTNSEIKAAPTEIAGQPKSDSTTDSTTKSDSIIDSTTDSEIKAAPIEIVEQPKSDSTTDLTAKITGQPKTDVTIPPKNGLIKTSEVTSDVRVETKTSAEPPLVPYIDSETSNPNSGEKVTKDAGVPSLSMVELKEQHAHEIREEETCSKIVPGSGDKDFTPPNLPDSDSSSVSSESSEEFVFQSKLFDHIGRHPLQPTKNKNKDGADVSDNIEKSEMPHTVVKLVSDDEIKKTNKETLRKMKKKAKAAKVTVPTVSEEEYIAAIRRQKEERPIVHASPSDHTFVTVKPLPNK